MPPPRPAAWPGCSSPPPTCCCCRPPPACRPWPTWRPSRSPPIPGSAPTPISSISATSRRWRCPPASARMAARPASPWSARPSPRRAWPGSAPRCMPAAGVGLGALGGTVPHLPAPPALAADELPLLAIGAHMSGLPLNPQMLRHGGRFLAAAAPRRSIACTTSAAGPGWCASAAGGVRRGGRALGLSRRRHRPLPGGDPAAARLRPGAAGGWHRPARLPLRGGGGRGHAGYLGDRRLAGLSGNEGQQLMDVDIPEVLAEMRANFAEYERALIGNDVEVLQALFRRDPAHPALRPGGEPARLGRHRRLPRRALARRSGANPGEYRHHHLRPRLRHRQYRIPPRRPARPAEPELGALSGRRLAHRRRACEPDGVRRRPTSACPASRTARSAASSPHPDRVGTARRRRLLTGVQAE